MVHTGIPLDFFELALVLPIGLRVTQLVGSLCTNDALMGRAGNELRPFEFEAPAPEQNQATILLPNMNIFRNILMEMNPQEDSLIFTPPLAQYL